MTDEKNVVSINGEEYSRDFTKALIESVSDATKEESNAVVG
jgi:hypothetical protein